MKLHKKTLLPLILSGCLLITTAAIAQDFKSINAGFEHYGLNTLHEKVFAHTDKEFYLSGEIMWFKLYSVDARTNKPSAISKIAYVEVLDADNNPIVQGKIAIKEGSGNGSFYIPVTIKNGTYKFRAYTNWMKNFSADLYFEKRVNLANPIMLPDVVTKQTKGNPSIDFFPEGGNLVNGVTGTVGFKAIDAEGKGFDIAGVVTDQHNDTVARFNSLKFGIGSFSFKPVANNTYKAVARVGKNNVIITALPQAADNGYAMQLTDDGSNNLILKISARQQGGNNQLLYVFTHSGHAISLAQSIMPDASGNAEVRIDKEKLDNGISHITLFNSAKQPVSERLYFKRPDLLTVIGLAQSAYKPRAKVNMYISAKDKSGKPQSADMSLAVYRLDSLTHGDANTIASYLWLTSEIKGDIESADYYFANVNTETNQALDNLLLTQGWSRFKWNEVLTNEKQAFKFLPEYEGHIVTGQLTNMAGTPTKDIIAYLGITGKSVQLYGANSDVSGNLLFNTKSFYGPAEMVIQTNTQKDSTYRITISNPFSEQYSGKKLQPFVLDSTYQNQLEINSIGMQVQNIYSANKLKRYYAQAADSSAFYGSLYKPYNLDDYTRFTTMEEDLREYVKEVVIARQQRRFHINIFTPALNFLTEGDPLVLIDGIPIFDMNKVFTMDMLKVKRLEMANNEFYWGPILAEGVLSFTSYKTDMAGMELDPKAIVMDYEGLQLERQFYSPAYETTNQQKNHLPDFRNTLYWSPDVHTDDTGKAEASFYTADMQGKYIAVMQGLTAEGLAGGYSFVFDVKK